MGRDRRVAVDNLDPQLLMWDMRRNIDPTPMPDRRTTIQVIFSDLKKAQQNYWVILAPLAKSTIFTASPCFLNMPSCSPTLMGSMTEICRRYTPIALA